VKTGSHARIYAIVRRIPRGRVATYGQVAELAGLPRQARLVGYALSALAEGSPVPWHRVVNARGAISQRGSGSISQRIRLVSEGVRVTARDAVDLSLYRWNPGQRPQKAASEMSASTSSDSAPRSRV
jgi:methylated-DNA-protein-cysteine methyltransferase related protein